MAAQPAVKRSISWTYEEETLMLDRINPGERLDPGDSRTSQNGVFTLAMQSTGRIVLRGAGGDVLARAPEMGAEPNSFATMQGDGNFVIRAPEGGRVTWATGTGGDEGTFGAALVVGDDGRVRIGSVVVNP